MRRREAYGVLLVAIGLALLPWVKPIGVIAILLGAGLILYGFLTPRVRY